eukprot:gene48351-64872_t
MIAGHRTSISVEQPFWDQLKDIAARQSMSTAAMIAAIDEKRGHNNLSSAIRLHVLAALIEQAQNLSGPQWLDRPQAQGILSDDFLSECFLPHGFQSCCFARCILLYFFETAALLIGPLQRFKAASFFLDPALLLLRGLEHAVEGRSLPLILLQRLDPFRLAGNDECGHAVGEGRCIDLELGCCHRTLPCQR